MAQRHPAAARLSVPQPAIELPRRTEVPPAVSTLSVLAAAPFAAALERERSLADRGTRRFSVIVLRRPDGVHRHRGQDEALADLSRRVCERLRTTDIVGRPDRDRVEILLTDTEPAGAQVVASWIEQIQAVLELDLELRIYVYPTVNEPSPDAGRAERPSRAPQAEEDVSRSPSTQTPGRNGHALRLLRGRWPMEDLWPELGAKTPLGKRALDVIGAGLALVALSPLLLLIGIAVRLDSPGPVFFKQQRVGRNGRPFAFYKFRSMVADAEKRRAALAAQNEKDGPIFKIRNDPRITRVGRLLRRWSLDELPQLWNVLKGDISLVGPRSPTLDEVEKYERWQRRRLSVIGGITCTWQVSGRSEISFRDWMRMDVRYIAGRSLWRDLGLLTKTVPAVISGRGAC